jgi:hypothetical protein
MGCEPRALLRTAAASKCGHLTAARKFKTFTDESVGLARYSGERVLSR